MKFILRFLFLFIFLILIGWAFWPEPRNIEEITLEIRKDHAIGRNEMQLAEKLNEYQVVINSPHSIEINETENIILLVERNLQAEEADCKLENPSDGTLAIEISIRIPNAEFNPGPKIIEPFIGQDSQIFIFNISAKDAGSNLSGDVWVYLLVYGSEDNPIERVPLIIIPLQIRLKQLLGFNPQLIKTISAGMFLFLFIFFNMIFPETRMI